MHKIISYRAAAILILLFLLHPNLMHAADSNKSTGPFSTMDVIQLVNGPNQIDLNGDGKKDLIFIAWRENYNAHSYSLFTFYIHFPDENRPEKQWLLVPFFDEKGAPKKESLSTEEGADCFLQDIRVLRSTSQKNMPVIVIVGKREYGDSYADEASVKFVVYELKQNKEGVPGEPPFSFEPKKTIKGKKKYCDINAAFTEELGVGDYEKRDTEK